MQVMPDVAHSQGGSRTEADPREQEAKKARELNLKGRKILNSSASASASAPIVREESSSASASQDSELSDGSESDFVEECGMESRPEEAPWPCIIHIVCTLPQQQAMCCMRWKWTMQCS